MPRVPEPPEERITLALNALAARLAARGIEAELYVADGPAVAIAIDAREAAHRTADGFDPERELRAAARQVGSELGLAHDWLDDGLRELLVAAAQARVEPELARPGLRVLVVSPRLQLALRVIAGDAREADDARLLADQLGLRNAAEVLAVVAEASGGGDDDAQARSYAQRLFRR